MLLIAIYRPRDGMNITRVAMMLSRIANREKMMAISIFNEVLIHTVPGESIREVIERYENDLNTLSKSALN